MSHNVIPCWFGERSRIHPCRNFTKHSRVLQNFLHSVEPFFLVEGNGKKNGFHRIVVTLIGGGLGVVAHADKEPVEMFVIFSAQCPAEFFPTFCGLLNQLNKCRDGSAHTAPCTFRSSSQARCIFL